MVRRRIDVFLEGLFRKGMFAGRSLKDAYFVDLGHSTMTKEDIDQGRLICVVGVAFMRPAEFTLLRIKKQAHAELPRS